MYVFQCARGGIGGMLALVITRKSVSRILPESDASVVKAMLVDVVKKVSNCLSCTELNSLSFFSSP